MTIEELVEEDVNGVTIRFSTFGHFEMVSGPSRRPKIFRETFLDPGAWR